MGPHLPVKPGDMTGLDTAGSIRPGSIVVGIDGSHHAEQALAWAAAEARLQNRPLCILHVEQVVGGAERGWLAQAGIPLTQIADEIRAGSEELLRRARSAAVTDAPALEVDTLLRVGDARQALLELAEHATMIVLGSRGRGPVTSLLLGSVSVAVSRHASCPVVVLRPREDDARLHGVLVGTDGSSRSLPTLEVAFLEASYRHLPLTVVHCQWEAISAPGGWRAAHPHDPFFDDARVRVAEVLAGLPEKYPDVQVTVEITAGHVDRCIADLSRGHDLTVVGRHGHSLWDRVGSFSLTTAIVEHSCGPVVIVP